LINEWIRDAGSDQVVRHFLASGYHDGIPFDELVDGTATRAADPDVADGPLDVYVALLSP